MGYCNNQDNNISNNVLFSEFYLNIANIISSIQHKPLTEQQFWDATQALNRDQTYHLHLNGKTLVLFVLATPQYKATSTRNPPSQSACVSTVQFSGRVTFLY